MTLLEGETAARKTVISSFASWTGEACSLLARTNREMHYGIGHANRYSVSMLKPDSWRSMPRPFHAAGLVSIKRTWAENGVPFRIPLAELHPLLE